MIVKRTEIIYLKHSDNISSLCHISKNLYNQANYLIKKELDENNKWLHYKELDELLKDTENYRKLNRQTSQQILRTLDKSWKAFFRAIKDWKKNPSKYLGMPRPPKYKKKNGEHMLIFTNQQCKIKDGILKFPKLVNFKLKTRITNKLNQVRIIPMGVGYKCEIIYEKEIKESKLKNNNIACIDLGLTNIVTMVNNIGEKPIIIKGGIVKSINQYFNKEKARLQNLHDKCNQNTLKSISKLYHVRNNKINDFFHKTSRTIINLCIKNDIKTLVIGYNEGWKQECNMGKRNNQNFVQVPFNKLVQQLEYKCEDAGITFVKQEESYTSKCSFLDNESICKQEQYIGKRFQRGLFKSSNGLIINADVNGAYNILKKAIPNAIEGIEDVALHPVSISHEHICY